MAVAVVVVIVAGSLTVIPSFIIASTLTNATDKNDKEFSFYKLYVVEATYPHANKTQTLLEDPP